MSHTKTYFIHRLSHRVKHIFQTNRDDLNTESFRAATTSKLHVLLELLLLVKVIAFGNFKHCIVIADGGFAEVKQVIAGL